MNDPILDFDIRDNSGNRVYTWFVDNAPAIDETIASWHTRAKGEPPHIHAMYHGLWRMMIEREQWGTPRAALQDTWPITDFTNPPSTEPPVVVIDPPLDANSNGGIPQQSADTSIRNFPKPSLPAQGYFKFPGYNVDCCKVTHEGHKVRQVGMSYWNNINAHRGWPSLRVFLSHEDRLFIFTIDKSSLQILDVHDTGISHTGEACYWDKNAWNILYFYQRNQFKSLNVANGNVNTLFETEGNIWQPHSSQSGKVHSFTLKDDNWNPYSWAVYDEITRELIKFPIEGKSDECQIDKSGNNLVIKEGYSRDGKIYDDVRWINLISRQETHLKDELGAPGHSDNGYGVIIGEDNYFNSPCAVVQWNMDGSVSRRLLYHADYWNMGHFSFCNAQDLPLENQKGLISPSGDSHSRGQELVSVKLNGSGQCLVLCHALSDFSEPPHANICPHGQFACWSAMNNGRRDVYVVRIPNW